MRSLTQKTKIWGNNQVSRRFEKIALCKGGSVEERLYKKKLHTFQVRENPNPDFKPKQVRNPGLGRLAKFQNGKLTNDFAWQSLTGVPDGQQGFMYGQFDNDGKMTGDEVGKKIKH